MNPYNIGVDHESQREPEVRFEGLRFELKAIDLKTPFKNLSSNCPDELRLLNENLQIWDFGLVDRFEKHNGLLHTDLDSGDRLVTILDVLEGLHLILLR